MGVVKYDASGFSEILDTIEGVQDAISESIGLEGNKKLWRDYLSGRLIKYQSRKDVEGRHLYAFALLREGSRVSFRSYPLNIWERPHPKNPEPNQTVRKGKWVLRRFGKDIRGRLVAHWAEQGITRALKKKGTTLRREIRRGKKHG